MNVGYNGCTVGARMIRQNEEKLNCNIPWTISLELDTQLYRENEDRYHKLICEGEALGIYTWMLFSLRNPENATALAAKHTDSAFCVFCEAEDLTEAFLEEVADLPHVMFVLRYDENTDAICRNLREKELLYSVWYQYGQKDTEVIINGDLFSDTQQVSPAFTVLVPDENCPDVVCRLAYQAVERARAEQTYHTIVWDLQGDNCLIDTIISGDACAVYFDKNGDLCDWNKKYECKYHNLFQSDLADILASACTKSNTALEKN